jgi:uncharacterized protein
MYKRSLEKYINSDLKKYKAIALVGPRQSGKTTLAKICAKDFSYINLENPDHLARAIDDPRLFLKSCKKSTILDEIQNAPELFSYLQEILDKKTDPRKFILTGSNSFQLNEKISQSLAGRIRIFNVLPLTLQELPDSLLPNDLDDLLLKGMYPRIYDENLDANDWFADYYQTYIQKDIKQVINVADSNQFDRFVRLCAGRVAQLGDYASVASEVGVSQPTAVRWASVLESSFITFRLQPHFKNFNKKIIKSPKIYFYDSGLLCQLLRIRTPEVLLTHPLRGEIFENFIVSEALKSFKSHSLESPLYYWRDQHGHEIDLVVDKSDYFHCVEVKSGSTFQKDWLKNLRWFKKLSSSSKLALIYGGDEDFEFQEVAVSSWRNLSKLIHSWY